MGCFSALCNRCAVQHHAEGGFAKLFADALCSAALIVSSRADPLEKCSIRYSCGDPVRGFVLDSNEDGSLRGMPVNSLRGDGWTWNSAADLEKLCGVNGSELEVTRSVHGRITRRGKLSSAFLQPSMAMAYFESVSDGVETEISSAISICANPEAPVQSAWALMLEAMPDCNLEDFEKIRNRLHDKAVMDVLGRSGIAPEEKLHLLLEQILPPDSPVPEKQEMERLPSVRFGCTCSRERMLAMAVRMLGFDDLKALLKEKPETVMRCHFCNSEYRFTEKDLPEQSQNEERLKK